MLLRRQNCGDFSTDSGTQRPCWLTASWTPKTPSTRWSARNQWRPEHREDPALLSTCARLSIRAELDGKARSYLQTSIDIRPRLEAWHLLATLLDQLGEREQANQALSNAL